MNRRLEEAPVALEDYAFVTAGTSDGLELLELLEHRAIDPVTWPRAEAYWLERLMTDLIQGAGALSLRLGELQAEARDAWKRPIPPLDEELGSWVSWSRQLSEQTDPQAWLAEQGLRPMDLLHLQKLWARRLAESEALRNQHAELVHQPLPPVELPRPAPPALPKPQEQVVDMDATGFARTLSDEEIGGSLPFEGRAAAQPRARFRAAPDLLSPLPPPPPDQGDVDGTAEIDLSILDASLPFVFQGPAEPDEAQDEAPGSTREQEPAAPPSPFAAVSPPPTPPAPSASPASPAQATSFANPVLPAVPPRVVIGFAGSLDHTAVGGVPLLSEAAALPFSGAASPPPAVSAELPPAVDVGSTAFVPILDLGPATPFEGGGHDVDATLVGGVPALGDALPFSGESVPPPLHPLAPAQPTGTVLGIQPSSKAALPFVAARGGEPALVPGGLTLRQLAALTVEMDLSFGRAAELLTRYGLTAHSFGAHRDAFRALVARDPAAQGRWDEAVAIYRRWRAQGT